ncbi:polyphenol oxidase, chloroplastic-like [Chenopodium quinoa]|nr:polyphenol oxidase, chloroplastic-like [Chenopodium quinoa]
MVVHLPILLPYAHIPIKKKTMHIIAMALLLPPSTTTNLSAVSRNPLLLNSLQLTTYRWSQTRRVTPKILCNTSTNDDQHTPQKNHAETKKLDRRNMLLGLGGLYGAATSLSGGYVTLAAPTAPDVSQCGPSILDNGKILNCCPPKPSQAMDFKLPIVSPYDLRTRPAAHLVDGKYLEKYSKALALMKALPDSDPRSFKQQANIHCAYCNDGYHQVGLPDLDFQVHGSWLFFPFHRAYLYFYEKILGKLIDDPNFVIPYWNWDHPNGMVIPSMFNDPKSPLFDPIRDQTHLPPTVMDLTYDGPPEQPYNNNNMSYNDQITLNLTIMYRQMVSNAKKPTMFLGEPYRAGDQPSPGSGSMENQPHGTVHTWTGNPPPNTPTWEDMGIFYSAGRDPIFYAHHAQVDRTWSIWKSLFPKNKDFKDKDFLNTYFYFYDENAKLIKIYVRDCLDTKKMGYVYQPMDLPWLKSRPTPRLRLNKSLKSSFSMVKNAVAAEITVPTITFPRALDHIIRTNLQRPQKSRSKLEKDDEEEILVIEVESRHDLYSKFDVYVNDEDEIPTKENRARTEYAGSYVNVPHKHHNKKGDHGNNNLMMKTTMKLGLTDLIGDLGADDDEGIDVIFVPRTGNENLVIKDVRIEFLC